MTATVTTAGTDLAKSAFQLHGVDRDGRAVLRRRLARSQLLDFLAELPPCRIGLEACASSLPLQRNGPAGRRPYVCPPQRRVERLAAFPQPSVARQSGP